MNDNLVGIDDKEIGLREGVLNEFKKRYRKVDRAEVELVIREFFRLIDCELRAATQEYLFEVVDDVCKSLECQSANGSSEVNKTRTVKVLKGFIRYLQRAGFLVDTPVRSPKGRIPGRLESPSSRPFGESPLSQEDLPSDSRKPKIFVSRTTKGLGAIAAAASHVLEQRGFQVIHQPDFGIGWRKIRQMLMHEIRSCDYVLCMIGPAYGAAPNSPIIEFSDPDSGREQFSYTQIEFLLARRLHKPIITLLLTVDFELEPFEQTDEDDKLQRDFIRDYVYKREHVYHGFSTTADLLEAVRCAELPPRIPPSTPENIPFPTIGSRLTGRKDTLREIGENLSGDRNAGKRMQAVQLIQGLGGVGKTRVAVEFAHVNANYSARLFVRGSSPQAFKDSLAQLSGLFLLNLEEQDAAETEVRVEAVLQWFQANPNYLLVIDNVDSEASRDAVVEVLPRLQRGHVIITSRIHTWPGNIHRLQLGELSDGESVKLLLNYRDSAKMPSDTDDTDARLLVRDLGGLPLALEQAAAYLNTIACTIAEYHERWRENLERVHQWHDDKQAGYDASVATTWLTSFDKLYMESVTLLNLLSWLAPDPIPSSLLKTLEKGKADYDLPDSLEPGKALGELMNFSLAKAGSGGRSFSIHRLVQQITRERQPNENSRVRPAVQWVSEAFADSSDRHSDDARLWPALVPLVPHAIAVGNFAADRDIVDPSNRLLSSAALLLHAQANYRTAEALYRRVLAIDEAKFGENDPRVASSLTNLAQLLLVDTGRHPDAEAKMQRALAINEAHFGNEHPKVAECLNNLALYLATDDRPVEAERLMRRALDIDEVFFGKDHPNVARDMSNLAQLLSDTGRYDEAEKYMWKSYLIYQTDYEKDHPDVSVCLNNLAQLMITTERREEAEPLMRDALEFDKQHYGEDHPNVADDLNNLSQWLLEENRLIEAEPLMRQALEIDEMRYRPDHPKIAVDLRILAELLFESDRSEEAVSMIRRARDIDERNFPPDLTALPRT